jgi:hypothetical protein
MVFVEYAYNKEIIWLVLVHVLAQYRKFMRNACEHGLNQY